MRKTRIKKKLCFGLGVIVLIAISIFAFRVDINVVEYVLSSDKVTDSIRIALIADLHSCDYGENQHELLSLINTQHPDIVLLGGDIVDDKLPQHKAIEFLSRISDQYPCYYVSGNHEFWSGDIKGIKSMIKSHGIHVLEGNSEKIEINGQTIEIFGIDDPQIGRSVFKRQLNDCGNAIDTLHYSILLTHRAEHFESYAQYHFDLILSGHTHGGQWCIPGVINGLFAPNQGLFPKYAGGLYQLDDTFMIVSRGLAKESTRLPRIFNRPEIVIIDIVKA